MSHRLASDHAWELRAEPSFTSGTLPAQTYIPTTRKRPPSACSHPRRPSYSVPQTSAARGESRPTTACSTSSCRLVAVASGDRAMGTVKLPMPVRRSVGNFSPMPHMAPPPLGNQITSCISFADLTMGSITGASTASSLLPERPSIGGQLQQSLSPC